MKILTFDIEDWFHVLDNESTQSEKSWKNFPTRLDSGVKRLLDICDNANVKGTFFTLGWVARHYPHIVKEIVIRGHHLGSHSNTHQLVYKQTNHEFRRDLIESIEILQDVSGQSIDCYRAPGFSITNSCMWAFETLVESGIKYDCSVFPASRAHGGLPAFPVAEPCKTIIKGNELRFFPINSKKILGQNLIYSGGGYFRLLPKAVLDYWFNNDKYIMTYFHPRDFDVNQPMIPGLSPTRKFKSYVGIKGATEKLALILKNNEFVSLERASQTINWEKSLNIKLNISSNIIT